MTEKTQTAAVLSALTDPTLLTTQAVALEISHLKELLETRISAIQQSIAVAHEDMVRVPTDVMKQVGTLKELHEEKFKDHECTHDEMKLACIKAETAADLRYSQRFDAQEKALEIALVTVNRALDIAIGRVDKEFHEHLLQVREETKTAFMNSERAIQKAETANEKRFEGINEFRGQLADQAATLMPRTESMALHKATAEKIDQIMTRLDKQEGRSMEAYPAFQKLMQDSQTLIQARSEGSGEKSGRVSQQQLITWILMVIVALIAIAGFFLRK